MLYSLVPVVASRSLPIPSDGLLRLSPHLFFYTHCRSVAWDCLSLQEIFTGHWRCNHKYVDGKYSQLLVENTSCTVFRTQDICWIYCCVSTCPHVQLTVVAVMRATLCYIWPSDRLSVLSSLVAPHVVTFHLNILSVFRICALLIRRFTIKWRYVCLSVCLSC